MLTWEIAGHDLVGEVTSFYRKNDHQNIAFRPSETERAVERGTCVVCTGSDGIVAGGLILDGEEHSYELGQGRVVLNGHSLYKQLIVARTVLAFYRDDLAEQVFCEIDEPNTKAIEVFRSLHYRGFEPSKSQWETSIMALPPEKRPERLGYDFVWFEVTRSEMEAHMNASWKTILSISEAGGSRIAWSSELAKVFSRYQM